LKFGRGLAERESSYVQGGTIVKRFTKGFGIEPIKTGGTWG
jgi:hypothetical protein